jgi:hypothetical protein
LLKIVSKGATPHPPVPVDGISVLPAVFVALPINVCALIDVYENNTAVATRAICVSFFIFMRIKFVWHKNGSRIVLIVP